MTLGLLGHKAEEPHYSQTSGVTSTSRPHDVHNFHGSQNETAVRNLKLALHNYTLRTGKAQLEPMNSAIIITPFIYIIRKISKKNDM